MYIGIDGGGTKTKMVSYDDDGNICQEIVLPTVHILSQTPKKCIEILKAGVEQLDPQSVSKIGIGLAGYGQDKKIRKEIEDYKNGLYAEYLSNPKKYEESHSNVEHINYLKNKSFLKNQ